MSSLAGSLASAFSPVGEVLVPKVFAWVDVETTGLEPQRDLLLEVAMVLTDSVFRKLVSSEHTVLLSSAELDVARERMPPVVSRMHRKSGLWDEVSVGLGQHLVQIDRVLSGLVREYAGPGGPKPWLAGNSVAFDRGFINANLPMLSGTLNYRSLDMTSVYGFEEAIGATPPPRAVRGHRAMSDIESALAEARVLRALRLSGDGTGFYPSWNKDGSIAPFLSEAEGDE